MHEEHLPQDTRGKLMHVVEECSEVQQAICKYLRFGPEDYNPYIQPPRSNKERVIEEMDDLIKAIERAKEAIK